MYIFNPSIIEWLESGREYVIYCHHEMVNSYIDSFFDEGNSSLCICDYQITYDFQPASLTYELHYDPMFMAYRRKIEPPANDTKIILKKEKIEGFITREERK